jgi:hypothetical protein
MGRHLAVKKIDPPDSEQLYAGGPRTLLNTWRVCILGTWWHIPISTTWDQASVPRPFRLVCAKDELGDGATLVHDVLCAYEGKLPIAWLEIGQEYRIYTCEEANDALHAMSLLEGARPWRANGAAAMVRAYWWGKQQLDLRPDW